MKPKRNYSSKKTSKYDNCQTPGYALEPLMKLPYFDLHRTIWECASGEGLLYDYMRNTFNHKIIGSDVSMIRADLSLCDFLYNYDSYALFDCIITNPPYSLKREFTKKCLELRKPWALLMPTETVSTKWFIEIAQKMSPKLGVIWLSPRVNFKMPNVGWSGTGAQFPVAWFTSGMEFEGNIFMRMDHWTKEYRKRFEL